MNTILSFIFMILFMSPLSSDNKIGIVLPSHNRPEYLERTLFDLSLTKIPENYSITLILLDDASEDQATIDLVKNFFWDNPNVVIEKIFLENNLGIAKTLEKGFSLLKNKFKVDFFCNIDSDVISKDTWLIKILEIEKQLSIKFKKNPIIYTAYNSSLHPIKYKQNNFAIKPSAGGLNFFFKEKDLNLVMKSLKGNKIWDWNLVKIIKNEHGFFVSTIPSQMQHIGSSGMHAKERIIDGQVQLPEDRALDF